MPKYLIICLFLLPICSFGQNLVVNSDFEDVNICKKYHESCSPKGWRALSLKLFGYETDENQNKYISLLVYDVSRKNDRRFAQSELVCPLIKGRQYKIRFKVKIDHFWMNQVTLAFLDSISFMKRVNLNKLPVSYLSFPIPKSSETNQWIQMEKIYTAKGNEKFILLGNLNPDKLVNSLPFDKKWHKKHLKSYLPKRRIQYGFDEIEIIPLNSFGECENFNQRIMNILKDSIRHSLYRIQIKEKNEILETQDSLLDVVNNAENVKLAPQKIVFKNLKFGINQWKLNNDIPQLNDLVDFMKVNPVLKIRISGYTDIVGTEEYNLELSKKRAESLKNYLFEHGISLDRMNTVGMGEKNAKSGNADRRVEVDFIK